MITVPGSIPKIILLFRFKRSLLKVRLNKNIKLIINYGLAPLLLVLIGYHLTNELFARPTFEEDVLSIKNHIYKNGIGLLAIAVFLMMLQWLTEAYKWKMLMSSSLNLNWRASLQMIFTGLSFSFITPFKSGEFIGRVMYLPTHKRAIGTTYTFYSSIIQFTVYSLLGALSLWMLDLDHLLLKIPASFTSGILFLKSISLFIPIVCLIFFITKRLFIHFFLSFNLLKKFTPLAQEFLSIKPSRTAMVFVLTFLKCFIFILEYWLIFKWLGVELSISQVFMGVSIMVFALAVMPTISFIEIGLRWEFSFVIFSAFTQNLVGVTIGTTIVWLLNIVLPAIIGAFWLLFRNQVYISDVE
ncbi:MAG: hypothetical protein RI965_758 [Bacteroidota bacterium]|jgi:Lysylphosphatidylglycerol synthase TM region